MSSTVNVKSLDKKLNGTSHNFGKTRNDDLSEESYFLDIPWLSISGMVHPKLYKIASRTLPKSGAQTLIKGKQVFLDTVPSGFTKYRHQRSEKTASLI